MAKSSIHIEAGAGGYFAHNSRETPTVNSVFSDEQNFCSCSKEDAFKLYRSELQIRSEAYTERTGQKLQKNAITHLSAIVNFNKDHTPEDMQRVCELLERKLDTKVLQMAMHRDEGKSADDKNYHAHIEFMGLDSRGESVRRKLDRPTLRELQSEVSKTLGMERGHDYAKERLPRPKRLDTYEYKAHKEGIEKEVKKVVLATQKDLNAEIALLRSQLKEQGATRSEYAQLEQINRELKEQIKAKDLTVDQLTKSLETVRSLNRYAESEKAELRAQIITKDQTIDQLKEVKVEIPHEPINARLIGDLKSEIEMLQISNRVLENELKETKSATVPKGENVASKQVEKYIEEMPRPTGAQLKTDELELRRFESGAEAKEAKYRYGEQYAEKIVNKHTNFVGKVDKQALIKELGAEFKETAQTLNRGLILVNDFKSAYERTTSTLKNFANGAEKAFKDVFQKITGKSTEQVNEQRREAERAIQQEKIKQAEAQKAKEPEQERSPSRGLSLGR